MTRYQRLTQLLELVSEQGTVEIGEIAETMKVSTATIRRDLDHLADQQLVVRTRGGALATTMAHDLPLPFRTAHAPEKQRIARAAAALVTDGMVVGMNGGTTTTEAARSIALRAQTGTDGNAFSVTIVTNALNIAHELAVRPNLKVVAVGGVVRPQSYELIGPLANLILNAIRLDVLMLGVDALDALTGASALNEGEASINTLMVSRAERVIALVDSSKLGRRAFANICQTDQISTLVTDTNADPEQLSEFRARGIKVITA